MKQKVELTGRFELYGVFHQVCHSLKVPLRQSVLDPLVAVIGQEVVIPPFHSWYLTLPLEKDKQYHCRSYPVFCTGDIQWSKPFSDGIKLYFFFSLFTTTLYLFDALTFITYHISRLFHLLFVDFIIRVLDKSYQRILN